MSIGKTYGGCSTCLLLQGLEERGRFHGHFFPQPSHHIKQNGYFGPLNGDLINVIWIGKLGMFTTNSAGRMT